MPVWCLFQSHKGMILHSLVWNSGFKNPWRQGLTSLPGGTTSVLLSSVCLAHSWHSVNTLSMSDWTNRLIFLCVGGPLYSSSSLCVCYAETTAFDRPTAWTRVTQFSWVQAMTTGDFAFPVLQRPAAIIIRLIKGIIRLIKPHIPVITMEGKWFLVEEMGEQGTGVEGRGIHPMFSVLSSPFGFVFPLWSNASLTLR